MYSLTLKDMRLIPIFSVLAVLAFSVLLTLPTSRHVRATGISYHLDHSAAHTPETALQATFLSSNRRTVPPRARAVWLKVPIPKAVADWEDGAVLFTASNEAAIFMHGYRVFESG